jgi:hypothetical protein
LFGVQSGSQCRTYCPSSTSAELEACSRSPINLLSSFNWIKMSLAVRTYALCAGPLRFACLITLWTVGIYSASTASKTRWSLLRRKKLITSASSVRSQ